jgi:hypothetical protein
VDDPRLATRDHLLALLALLALLEASIPIANRIPVRPASAAGNPVARRARAAKSNGFQSQA